MSQQIEFGMPFIDQEDLENLNFILREKWILNGPKVREFENEFSRYIGCKYAVAVSSCTAGMHLSLSALGVREGDEVIIPAFSFVANGLAVLQVAAIPRFVDVDPLTCNIDVSATKEAISERTKAILVLHYAGLPANLDQLLELSHKYNIPIIEDAAHALGAQYRGQKIGNFGDATVFSFGPLKMITTAGMGGMITTNRQDVYEKIKVLRSYGMNKSMWDRKQDQKPWKYEVSELGHNFRMTDICASMGLSQLRKLDSFLAKRRKLAELYSNELGGIDGIAVPSEPANLKHAYLYYVIKIDRGKYGMSRDSLALYLKENGVGTSVHWDPPLHRHILYKKFTNEKRFPNAEKLSKMVLSLPLHPKLDVEDVGLVISLIKRYLH